MKRKRIDADWILRDYLAYDRTRLALVRTMLSFGRTALGLVASGIGLMIVKDEAWCRGVGVGIIVLAVLLMIGGGIYCGFFKKHLDDYGAED